MGEFLARVQTAFVSEDAPTTWTIGNDLVRMTLGWEAGRGWRVANLVHATSGHTWTSDGAFALAWNGTRLDGTSARSVKGHAEDDGTSVTLLVTLDLADDLQVLATYRATPQNAVIQSWLQLLPQATGTVEAVQPLQITFDHDGVMTLRRTLGIQSQGHWRPDSGPYTSFMVDERPLDDITVESGPRSTWTEIPWFALGDDVSGEGIFVGLQYSARWSAHFGRGDGSSVTATLDQVGIKAEVTEGQRWTSPKIFVGVYKGDLDDASAVQQRFYRTVLSPPLVRDFPWVQYNTWFSYGCDFDDQTLRKEVDIAAELGVEVFYIDAGWWMYNPRHGDAFSSGLGNWTENPEKFPDGIRAFADYVRDNDMRFGIWVEPERVDLRTLATGTWKEEWLAVHDGTYVRAPWPNDTETGWLCFGHPEAQAWSISWISDMVEAYDLAWIKWDSNYWGVCTATDHGHGAGDGEEHQVAGVHAVLQELRRRFPNLVLENCAGGGTRMDFAMSEQTHTAWVNDATEPSHRVRFHLAGLSYMYPPEVLNTWVSESDLENLNGRVLPRATLQSIFRSRMLGAMGISCRMVEWLPATRQVMGEAIAEYKALRPLLRAGRIYHLLPQPRIESPRLATPDAWEAYQFFDPATARGVVLVFRGVATDAARSIPLKGLGADQHYKLEASDGTVYQGSGAALMTDGLPCSLLPLTSELWQLEMSDG
jgi:alpha-galactosidase